MSEGIKTVIYPVSDLARAKAAFSVVLGAAPDMDEPYYCLLYTSPSPRD